MSNNKRLVIFIAVTCLLSWAMGGAIYLAGIKVGSMQYVIAGALYMLVPALVALLLQKYIFKEKVVKPFRISFKLNLMFVVALFTPIVIMLLSLGLSLLIPGIEFSGTGEGIAERYADMLSPDQLDLLQEQISAISPMLMFLMVAGQGILAACTINALFAFGEELGWRGYMLYYLRNSSVIKASIVIGAIWGVWHFPLILMGHNYPDYPVAGVFMMIVFCILLTPVMIYIVLKSKSVLSAAVFHGSINAFAGFPLIYMMGGNGLNSGVTGYAGFGAIIIVTSLFILYDKYISKEKIFGSKLKRFYEQETEH